MKKLEDEQIELHYFIHFQIVCIYALHRSHKILDHYNMNKTEMKEQLKASHSPGIGYTASLPELVYKYKRTYSHCLLEHYHYQIFFNLYFLISKVLFLVLNPNDSTIIYPKKCTVFRYLLIYRHITLGDIHYICTIFSSNLE